MSNNYSLNLGFTGILFLALISILIIFLLANRTIKDYLNKSMLIDAFVGSILLLSFWFIGNEFIAWWISAIISLVLTYLIEKFI